MGGPWISDHEYELWYMGAPITRIEAEIEEWEYGEAVVRGEVEYGPFTWEVGDPVYPGPVLDDDPPF